MAIIHNKTSSKSHIFLSINHKEGCFSQSTKGEDGKWHREKFEPSSMTVEGYITGINYAEDTYQDNNFETVRFSITDPNPAEPVVNVQFTFSNNGDPSVSAMNILARLNSADFTKPVSLSPYFVNAGTRLGSEVVKEDFSGTSVKQDGQRLEFNYGPDVEGNIIKHLPPAKRVQVGSKVVLDKSEWNVILDNVIQGLNDKFNEALPVINDILKNANGIVEGAIPASQEDSIEVEKGVNQADTLNAIAAAEQQFEQQQENYPAEGENIPF